MNGYGVDYDASIDDSEEDPVGENIGRAGLTEPAFRLYDSVQMAKKAQPQRREAANEDFLKPREAALELRVSFPTIKQWIYKRKIRSIRTAGGHHRIPQDEIDRLLFRTRGKTAPERGLVMRRVSGRNQLVGRIESVQISGLMAEVKLSIGDQRITSIITASSAREMNLK